MSNLRLVALHEVTKSLDHKKGHYPEKRITDFCNANVCTGTVMREYRSNEAYKRWQQSTTTGTKADRRIADQIAASRKAWAQEKGVTHFSHRFQPLTGTTAEK